MLRLFMFTALLISSLLSKDSIETLRAKGQAMPPSSWQYQGKWEGYYYGVLPCSTCQGVETWLHLKKNANRGTYEMREKYLGEKNRYAEGGLGWMDNSKIAYMALYNNRRLVIGEDYVNFLDYPKGKLKRVHVFKTMGSLMLVDFGSLLRGNMNGQNVVRFRGVINYDKAVESGYKSSQAKYLIKCRTKEYEMSHISYYKGRYTMRDFVYIDAQKTKGHISDNKLISQAYKKYCFE